VCSQPAQLTNTIVSCTPLNDIECQVQNFCRIDTDPDAPCTYCGDGVTDTAAGEACDDGNNVNDDDCDNNCQLPGCDLIVEKEGCVEAPSGSCESKAVAFTLEYMGDAVTDALAVVLTSGDSTVAYDVSADGLPKNTILTCPPPATASYTCDGGTGDEGGFTLNATKHNDDKFESQTTVQIITPSTTIVDILHTSCSCPVVSSGDFNLVVDQPMCLDSNSPNNPGGKGEPSPNWTLRRLWDLELGILGGTGECNTELPALPRERHCKGGIIALGLQYDDDNDCGASNNKQIANGQFTCTDYAPLTASVYIVFTKNDGTKQAFMGTKNDGDVFDVLAANAGTSKLEHASRIQIFDAPGGNLLQEMELGTHCHSNQVLNVGDQFGSLFVETVHGKEFGVVSRCADVNYTYTVTNDVGECSGSGDPCDDVNDCPATETCDNITNSLVPEVYLCDDPHGPIPPPSGGNQGPLNDGESTGPITVPIRVCGPTINTVTAQTVPCNGPPTAGQICGQASASITEPPPPPKVCDGGVTDVLLRWTGDPMTNVTVEFSADKGKIVETYSSIDLNPGDILCPSPPCDPGEYTLSSAASGEDKFGSKMQVSIDGKVTDVLHTSCSCEFTSGVPGPADKNDPNDSTKSKCDPSPNWFVEDFDSVN
jgi:hypothetical protein